MLDRLSGVKRLAHGVDTANRFHRSVTVTQRSIRARVAAWSGRYNETMSEARQAPVSTQNNSTEQLPRAEGANNSAWLGKIRTTLRALQHRNFQLFLGGQFLSLIGTWVQNVAQSWLIYRLTNSSAMLGLITFAGQIPYLL